METKKLFVGGLSWGINWQELKDIFGEFGEVVFARVITDRETGKSRGFGFLEFANIEDAKKAKEELD
jgi:RNA recognition motif-containing protein